MIRKMNLHNLGRTLLLRKRRILFYSWFLSICNLAPVIRCEEEIFARRRHLLQWGPPKRKKRQRSTPPQGRPGMTDEIRVAIETGEGCWWQDDNWKSVIFIYFFFLKGKYR
mmetsp:Transcript_22930/g.28577  ORF Transcript_22930/g.28577 Transcript_22930/m.28577 type:complete len:111 (-) Transcript_22930:1644-1976(-)